MGPISWGTGQTSLGASGCGLPTCRAHAIQPNVWSRNGHCQNLPTGEEWLPKPRPFRPGKQQAEGQH